MTTLTDKEACITKIETGNGITTITLEWGGPDDRTMADFDRDLLGDVVDCGDNCRAAGGWVIVNGSCLLGEGDTIPYVPGEE